MRSFRDLLIVLVAWVLSACTPPDGPMLHRMGSYAGEVTWVVLEDGVEKPDSGESCDLAFHRGNGNLQAKFTRSSRVVSLVRGADEQVRAFEDARSRPPSPAETVRFRIVQDLVHPGAIEAERPGTETYRVRCRGVWYRVTLQSQSGTRVHGQPK